jgi:hypothetical protein
MPTIPLTESLENLAFLLGVSASIRPGVMHQSMHVLSEQFRVVTVTQQSKTRSIAESANSFKINGVNCLCSGVEQQSELLFGLPFQV